MSEPRLELDTFSPTVAELQSLVVIAKEVDVNNLNALTSVRISLKNARVRIEKRGKEFRADAVKFQKAVIAKEKELIAIIEPEETRLEAIEEEVKAKKLREERVALLPERWAKIDAIQHPGSRQTLTDEDLLGLDATAFQGLLNHIVADKNLIEQARIDADRAKLDEERAKIARDKELAEREEIARQQEREAAERHIVAEREATERRIREEREAADRRIQEERESAERRERERVEREAREKAEAEEKTRLEKLAAEAQQKALENQEAYKAFMDKHGLLNPTREFLMQHYILNDNTDAEHPKVKLYKLLDTLELKI